MKIAAPKFLFRIQRYDIIQKNYPQLSG
ncbi:unnamed protein product, partial [Rotaria sp. Silwood2]